MEKTLQILLASVDNPYVFEMGGKHVHLLLLERGLKSLGVQISTLYYRGGNVISEFFKGYVRMMLPMYLKYQVTYRNMINYLGDNAPNEEFDLIHAHDNVSLVALRSRPEKKILTVHGYFAREHVGHPAFMNDGARIRSYYALLQLEKEGLDYADYAIAVDSRLKNYIASEFGYPEDRIAVVYNSVDTDRFHPISSTEGNKLKMNLGYSEDDFIVLIPRRLVEKNGVIYAVKAMKFIEKENVNMIIAGDGSEKSNIARAAQKDRRIRLVGSVSYRDIDVYYKAADAVLIPSVTTNQVQEASSLAMLEGMSCGKVVICSNVGGMREIVHNLETGILTEEKKPEDIAGAIKVALENRGLRSKIASKARIYVLQNHSYLVHAKKMIEIYRNVLE